MQIRVHKKTDQEINRIIKNFNQKVARLEKTNRDNLPPKITKKELMSSSNRAELNRKLNQLKRFSRREVEDVITTTGGVDMTRWERNNLSIELRTAKAKLTRNIKGLTVKVPKIAGIKQDATFAQMGDEQYRTAVAQRQALNKNLDKLSREEIDKLLRQTTKILDKSRDRIFKESYFKMIEDIAYLNNFDSDKLEEIKDKLDKLPNSKFIKLFNEDKAITDVLYRYKSAQDIFNTDDEQTSILLEDLYENIDQIVMDYL